MSNLTVESLDLLIQSQRDKLKKEKDPAVRHYLKVKIQELKALRDQI